MRIVSEQCTVLVPKSEVAKFIGDKVKDGWQVQSTGDASGYSGNKGEVEVEVRLVKQHDINAPAVKE